MDGERGIREGGGGMGEGDEGGVGGGIWGGEEREADRIADVSVCAGEVLGEGWREGGEGEERKKAASVGAGERIGSGRAEVPVEIQRRRVLSGRSSYRRRAGDARGGASGDGASGGGAGAGRRKEGEW